MSEVTNNQRQQTPDWSVAANQAPASSIGDDTYSRLEDLFKQQKAYRDALSDASKKVNDLQKNIANSKEVLKNLEARLKQLSGDPEGNKDQIKDITQMIQFAKGTIAGWEVQMNDAKRDIDWNQEKVSDFQRQINQLRDSVVGQGWSQQMNTIDGQTQGAQRGETIKQAAQFKLAAVAIQSKSIYDQMDEITDAIKKIADLETQAQEHDNDADKYTKIAVSTGIAAGANFWMPPVAAALAATAGVYAKKADDAKKDAADCRSQEADKRTEVNTILNQIQGSIQQLMTTSGAELQEELSQIMDMIKKILALCVGKGPISQSTMEKVQTALAEVLGALGSTITNYNRNRAEANRIVNESGQRRAENDVSKSSNQLQRQEDLIAQQLFNKIFMDVIQIMLAINSVGVTAASGGTAATAVAGLMALLTISSVAMNKDLMGELTKAIADSLHTGNSTADKVLAEFIVAVIIVVLTLGADAAAVGSQAAKQALEVAQTAIKTAMQELMQGIQQAGKAITKEELQQLVKTALSKIATALEEALGALKANAGELKDQAKAAVDEFGKELTKGSPRSISETAVAKTAARAAYMTTAGFCANNGLLDLSQLAIEAAGKDDPDDKTIQDLKYALMALQGIIGALAGAKGAGDLFSADKSVIENLFGSNINQIMRIGTQVVQTAGQGANVINQSLMAKNSLDQADVQQQLTATQADLTIQNSMNKISQETEKQRADDLGAVIQQDLQMISDISRQINLVNQETARVISESIA